MFRYLMREEGVVHEHARLEEAVLDDLDDVLNFVSQCKDRQRATGQTRNRKLSAGLGQTHLVIFVELPQISLHIYFPLIPWSTTNYVV